LSQELPTLWAFVCLLSASMVAKQEQQKNVFPTTLVSGLVAKSLFFVVVVAVVVIVVVVVSGFVVLD
jgi:hypothetical protein